MQARVRDPTDVCPATAMAKRNASASVLQREVTEVVRRLARGPLIEEFVEPSTGYSIDIWLPSLQVACVPACMHAYLHACMLACLLACLLASCISVYLSICASVHVLVRHLS